MLQEKTEVRSLASCDELLCSLGGAKVKEKCPIGLVVGVTSNKDLIFYLMLIIYAMHIHHTTSLSKDCHWKPPPITTTSSPWQPSLDPDVSASARQRNTTAQKSRRKTVIFVSFCLGSSCQRERQIAVIPSSVLCGFVGVNISTQSLYFKNTVDSVTL